MADLDALTSSALLEDLAKLRRYRDDLVRTQGLAAYQARANALIDELRRRNVALPADPVEAAPAPCRLRPLGDHVVVQPQEADSMTAGGILVPDTAKEKPMHGTVVAVGPGRTEPGVGTIVPMVAVGDVVLFGRYAGTEVLLDAQRVLILREDDVLGVLLPPA